MSTETITLIAAIALTAFGVGAFVHYVLWVGSWPRTSGKVVGNEARKSGCHRPDACCYFPRVAFIAADGRTYEVRGDVGLAKQWPLGRIISLRYRPANPKHASIAKDWQRLVFAVIFLGLAAASWWAWLR